MKKLKRNFFVLLVFILITMSSMILTACQVEFKVDFIVDGEVYDTLATKGKEKIKLPKNPTKEGYEFDGWYWDEGEWTKPFTVNSLLDTPLSEDLSVYAKFTSGNEVQGTEIELDGFVLTNDSHLGDIYVKTLPYEQVSYAFSADVKIDPLSTWTLSTDASSSQLIASKTIELSAGESRVLYILVTDKKGNVEQYKVKVERAWKQVVEIPEADETVFVYNGQEQTYNLTDLEGYSLSGNLTAKNAGTNVISLKLDEDCIWADGTFDNKNYQFTINKKDASEAIFEIEDIIYGEKPQARIELEGFELDENDYTVAYGNYHSVNEAVQAVLTFNGNFSGGKTASYAVKVKEITPTVILSKEEFVYTGYAQKPIVTVKDGETQLRVTQDYTLQWENIGSAAIGLYDVTITLKGNYDGTATASYRIDSELFVNKTDVALWSEDEIDGKCSFSVDVRAGADFSLQIKDNLIFSGINNLEYRFENNEWKVTVPISELTVGEPKTISVEAVNSNKAAKTININLDMSDKDYYALLKKLNVFMPMDGSIADMMGHSTSMGKGDAPVFDDNKLKVTTSTSTVVIDGVTLGTDDFVMSFDLRLDNLGVAVDARYEIVSTEITNDNGADNFQFSWHGRNNCFRCQIGKNDSNSYFGMGKSYIGSPSKFYHVVIAVDRKAMIDNSHTTTYGGSTYATNEMVRYSLYVDGVLIDEKERWMNSNDSLGNGKLYLGGSNFMDGGRYSSTIDNFVFCNSQLTAQEMLAFSKLSSRIKADLEVSVSDVSILNTDTDIIDSGELALVVNGKLARIKDLPEGMTLAGTEGAYKLLFSADAIASIKPNREFVAVFDNGFERKFTIRFNDLEDLYATRINLEAWDEGTLNKEFTVTVDEANEVPYGGAVDFGPLSAFVTGGVGKGVYSLIGDRDDILSAYGDGVEITTLEGSVKGDLVIDAVDYLVDDEKIVYEALDANINDETKGRVYENVRLGTSSFTVSLMVDDTYNDGSWGRGALGLYGTANVDSVKNGFYAYYYNKFRHNIYGSSKDEYGSNWFYDNSMKSWHNITAYYEVTPIENGYKINVTSYIDYTKKTEMPEFTVDADYSANWKNDDGTYNYDFFVGCSRALGSPAKNKVLGTSNVVVCLGIMPLEKVQAKMNASCGSGYTDRIVELNAISPGNL